MKGKKILLAAPKHFDLFALFEKNLRHLGFDVVICNPPGRYKYKNILQKLTNFWYKATGIDKDYKKKLKQKAQHYYYQNILSKLSVIDYALFIRADLFDLNFIQDLRAKTEVMIAYQYDSIERYPEIRAYFGLFDRFFIFDPADLAHNDNKFKSLTNFYFDFEEDLRHDSENQLIYFIGSYESKRLDTLFRLEKSINDKGFKYLFKLLIQKSVRNKIQAPAESNIVFTTKPLRFSEYLNEVKKAGIIVDIVIDGHLGLSFRVFEALKDRKKLITSNTYVKQFDFFHPNNIFIIENNDYSGLDAFLDAPYVELSHSIRAKYSFTNWINNVLDAEPYQEIVLPALRELKFHENSSETN